MATLAENTGPDAGYPAGTAEKSYDAGASWADGHSRV